MIDSKSFDAGVAKFLKELPDLLVPPMQKACMIVVRDAKILCPVDTGTLRNSIQYKVDASPKTTDGYVYTNIEYAPYVEIGTGFQSSLGNGANIPGHRPQPFLKPAAEKNRTAINNCFRGII